MEKIDILVTLQASLLASAKITLLILALMIVVELLVLKFEKRIVHFTQKNKFLSYLTASFFGSVPGCIGTFAMDSLYMAGLLGFGGILAAMVATSGDEAFLLISLAIDGEISFTILAILFGTLFLLGILAGWGGDLFAKKTNLKVSEKCAIVHHGSEKFNLKHFLGEHILSHIVKKHIWQIFLWIFAAIFAIEILQSVVNLENIFSHANFVYILLAAALIGILPISGPNVVLVMLFVKGFIPFSILLTNSIIQDGHGLLPILGFSFKDAVKIKAFNFCFGLLIGGLLLFLGF